MYNGNWPLYTNEEHLNHLRLFTNTVVRVCEHALKQFADNQQ